MNASDSFDTGIMESQRPRWNLLNWMGWNRGGTFPAVLSNAACSARLATVSQRRFATWGRGVPGAGEAMFVVRTVRGISSTSDTGTSCLLNCCDGGWNSSNSAPRGAVVEEGKAVEFIISRRINDSSITGPQSDGVWSKVNPISPRR